MAEKHQKKKKKDTQINEIKNSIEFFYCKKKNKYQSDSECGNIFFFFKKKRYYLIQNYLHIK